jgi:hypothetical protein
VADVTSHTLNNSSEECSGPVARVSAGGSDDLMATAALVYRGRGRCQGVRNIRQAVATKTMPAMRTTSDMTAPMIWPRD